MGVSSSGGRTLQQGCSVVHRLVGDHFVSGADAAGVGQPVQVLDVAPAIVPHLGEIWRRREGRGEDGGESDGGEIKESVGAETRELLFLMKRLESTNPAGTQVGN